MPGISQSYVLDAETLALMTGEDKLILSDGTEYLCIQYICSYGCQDKNEVPEMYAELKTHMEASENVTEFTIIDKLSDEESVNTMQVVKGDTLEILLKDEAKYGLFYDAEGLHLVGDMKLQSEEDSLTIYILEK